ncbi:hypothetical protein NRE35_004335 [Salmonella enterica]|nr:hypothetical protein [Salmonella enterica]
MNQELVIINSLLLLFWGSHQEQKNSIVIDTVKEAMSELQGIGHKDADASTNVYVSLRTLITRLCTQTNEKIDRKALMRQVTIMANHDTYVSDLISQSITQDLDEEGIAEEISVLVREINEQLKKMRFVTMLQGIAKEYVYSGKEYNLAEASRVIIERAESYAVSDAGEGEYAGVNAVVNSVDFENDEQLEEMFDFAQREISPDEILKFPLQGLNKMTGKQMGGRRGECCVVGGLSHHGKSVTAMMITRGIAMYTDPKPHKEGAIPTILIISAENDLTINIRELYGQCYVNVYKQVAPDLKSIDPVEAAKFIKETMGQRGWRVLMVRINPDEFTLTDFQTMIYGLEAKNHEIIVCCFDYLSMMSTRGIESTIAGQDKQLLWKRVRNMMTVRNTFFISPHQLSTEAQMIERDRPNKFLEEILNRGYYKECRSLHQEVDLEINLQKLKINGITYVGYGRGKHRGVNDTPEADKVCWYQLTELGILDDVNDEESRAMDKPGRPVLADDDFWTSAPTEPAYAVQ